MLWDQHGSDVLWGDLTVIPIEESLLYVQPLYLRARGGRIPELKQVVLAHGSRVVMAETLAGALAGMFGLSRATSSRDPVPGTAASAVPGGLPADSVAYLIRRAAEHYEAACAA